MLSPLSSIDPVTGQVIAEYPQHSDQEIQHLFNRSDEVQSHWQDQSYAVKKQHMLRLAQILENKKTELTRLMAQEMGKLLTEGEREIEKCVWLCRWFAEHAQAYLRDENVETEMEISKVSYHPLGVILAIMPWNFPFWQVFRCAVPAVMAGNSVILKHAPSTQGCALAIELLFEEAGFPKALMQHIRVDNQRVKQVIQHPSTRMINFTGSTQAGKIVATQASEVLIPCVLELGGSDPYLILEDADLEIAVEACTKSRWLNVGQSCIAAKRLIVHQAIYQDFLDRLVNRAQNFELINPLNKVQMVQAVIEKTNHSPDSNTPLTTSSETNKETTKAPLGPMARIDLRNHLHEQVQESCRLGARCVIGGEIPDHPGAFYPATILTNVRPGMPAFDEELFGPVAVVIKAVDDHDAITLANTTSFGLGAAIFTKDQDKITKYPARLRAANVGLNQMVSSDPRLPFGGFAQSGWGKELGREGIRSFTLAQTIVKP